MKFWLAFTSSVLLCAVLLPYCPTKGESALYGDVVRLRVIAESDSKEDQELKLTVRDAVLSCAEELFADCANADEAEKTARAAAEVLRKTAQDAVGRAGKSCPVRVEIGREAYPRRDYGDFEFPAGEYRSVRIILGDGEGRNWWCVLFPGLCVRAARAGDGDALAVGLTPEEYRIITKPSGRVRVRFRILELLSDLLGIGTGNG